MENRSLKLAQTMLTVTILFLVVIETFFDIYAGEETNLVKLTWFAFPGLYIFIYLLIFGSNSDNFWLRFALGSNLFLSGIILIFIASMDKISTLSPQIQGAVGTEFTILGVINFLVLPIIICYLAWSSKGSPSK